MTSALRTSSGKKNRLTQSTKFLEDREALTEESINRISEALRSTKNLDQLVNKIITSATKSRRSAKDENIEIVSPFGRATLSGSKSSAGPISFFQHMEHLNSSDEDECTFHPKVNNKPHFCTQRIIPNNDTNEFLHRHAKDRSAKKQEHQDINQANVNRMTTMSKIGPKSVQIVFKKLQQAVKSLINDSESQENPGHVTFEGLGTILYRIGLFQNLEFKPQENDPDRSSVTINHARVKPERLSREIQYHENLWKICALASKDKNFISIDLLFKFLLILVEEKTEVVESACFLVESVDRALEANGQQREEGKSLYLEIKDQQNLWPLEQLVIEFRRLFDDKTSFMNIYNTSNNIVSKKDKYYPHTHTPQTNKKSQKLDSRYFTQTMAKKLEDAQVDINKSQDRKLRLYNYHKYLIQKKNENLEAKINEELAPCTFAPAITPYKKQKQRPTVVPNNESPNAGDSSPKKGYFSQALEENLGPKRQLLMYEVAHHYKEKLHQKAYALKKKEEIQELSHCTFEPRLNKNYEDSAVRHQDFYERVPNGFKKVVERLHKGEQQKSVLKAALEKVPRGENYEKNRNAGFNPPSQLERPKIKRKEVLVYVDVSIGHGRTGRIGIHKGDNAKALAHYFARTYSLNANMQDSLEKLLQSYIDSYFAQSPQNEPVDQDMRRNNYQEEEGEYYEEEDEEEEEEGVEEVEEEEEEEEEDQEEDN
jgi:hypothetical protein